MQLSQLLPPRPRISNASALRALRRDPRRDAIAGVAVAAYLVPQCLAYATLAGLAPVRGLWAALPALVVYALIGTSSRLSIGPESASALLVGSAVATLTASGELGPSDAAAALALAVAAITLVAWVARLGVLADLLSRPVLVGYLVGVAVTMVVSQLPNVTGIPSAERDTLPRLVDVLTHLDEVQLAPLLLAAAVVVALFALQRLPRVPGTLLVVLVATGVTSLFELERHHVETLGHVPQGLPAVAFPSVPLHLWPGIFGAALGVAVVAYGGNVLTARAFARRAGDEVDADQELLALGASNAAAGMFGGFPVSTSDSRSALVDATGGCTQLVSVVAAACVAGVLLAAGSLLAAFPLAALGGLVIYAGIRLIDVREIRRIVDFRHSEAAIMVVAAAGVVVFDLLVGIGVAVALSIADLFRRVARAHDAVLGSVPGLAGLHDVDDYPEATTIPGLVVYRYDAPLFFANAEDFETRVLAVVDATAHVEWVVLNMEANVEVDLTALDRLEELRMDLESRGVVVALARVKQDLAVYLERTGFLERIGREHVYPTLPTALEAFRSRGAS